MTGELERAVGCGLVFCDKVAGGWAFTGAAQDILVSYDLEEMGAVWEPGQSRYFLDSSAEHESVRVAKRCVHKSIYARRAMKAAAVKVTKEGAYILDRERRALMRDVSKRVKSVYKQAIAEYTVQLNKLIAKSENPNLKPEKALELAKRRGELEGIIDALADGLANAGGDAARASLGMLPNARATGVAIADYTMDKTAGCKLSRMLGSDTAALAQMTDFDLPKWTEDEIAEVTKLRQGYDRKAWAHIADKKAAKRQLQDAVSRGLLTGEHPEKVAKRISKLFDQWEGRALTIARTETARVMSDATYKRAQEAAGNGVHVKLRWRAKIDDSTRDSHRDMDGETVELGKPFSNGQLHTHVGPASEVINCRCCTVEVPDGFDIDTPIRDVITRSGRRISIDWGDYDPSKR